MTTHLWYRWRALLAAVVLCFTMTGIQSVLAEPAHAGPVYQVVDADNDPYNGIYLRRSAAMGDVERIPANYMTYGSNIEILCQKMDGEAVGPYANRHWYIVRTPAGRQGWLADRYTNTPVAANVPLNGVPTCGTTPPPAGNPSLPVWCGSPVDGTWSSSHPRNHGAPYGGDWSGDLPAGTQNAQLYCAPQDGQSQVTARVESVRPACRSGVIGDGGYAVQVGIFNGTARIGWYLIAHVNPSVSVGQEIARWGGTVGQIGTYRYPTQQHPNGCWSGRHAHVEMYNVRNYSCYSRTWDYTGRNIYKSNFIGFLGGNYARGFCP